VWAYGYGVRGGERVERNRHREIDIEINIEIDILYIKKIDLK
jgi:hypothetical protein